MKNARPTGVQISHTVKRMTTIMDSGTRSSHTGLDLLLPTDQSYEIACQWRLMKIPVFKIVTPQGKWGWWCACLRTVSVTPEQDNHCSLFSRQV